ncbi:hypothetical protein HanHA300_Chr08g0275501 [Helianthus annuus]|nr:hypothetical protein HanHA300_Chr08g0275501 [Helianthus annuus]KAJ0546374.1 hypothetical protein HanIR_Chr08g0360231 [Helianthus annuus]KAJ0553112.1 hypothetical protein HanHA89_Chr08g0292801 [Helianthus annuus]
MGHMLKHQFESMNKQNILVEKDMQHKISWQHVILICVLHLHKRDGKALHMTQEFF